MVNATVGHELLNFMDAFSGYNQILMHPNDQEKTAFITERGTYCYKVIPFGLKNARATYQRLVNKMFSDHLGKTMEVYIDDMLIKSLIAEQHLDHLSQAFAVLRKYNMKLNPNKCSFGVLSVELSEFDIVYQSRTAVKSQALADFIADFTPSATTQAERELLCMNGAPPLKWTLLVDGSSNVNGSELGIVLITPEGDIIQRAIQCGFKCMNNEAEYEALLAGLSLAREIGAKRLEVKSDSQLVVNQLQGMYQARDSKMTSYLSMVKELQAEFEEFSIWPANWKESPPNKSPVEAMGVEQADYWMTPK
ncbi:uncharacterized protein LOC116139573 [Pistacia vera]|uniref:uncharacterized protein LOC116139573 n=1 Tax=Pistacia vera TaxID=55513 RepID=UPI001262B8D9|nr:uncharacterized protein LOC116139573 [Pistacia vera]